MIDNFCKKLGFVIVCFVLWAICAFPIYALCSSYGEQYICTTPCSQNLETSAICDRENWVQYTQSYEQATIPNLVCTIVCALNPLKCDYILNECTYYRCSPSTTSCSAADKCGAAACPWGGKYICPGYCLGPEGCGAGTTAYKEACNGGVATEDYKGDCYSSSGSVAFCDIQNDCSICGQYPGCNCPPCGQACEPQQQCGNNVKEGTEECDPGPSLFQANSPQCPQQSWWCINPKFCARDDYGNCNNCACENDWANCVCIKNACGATCAVDSDCTVAGQSCDLDTCTCTSTPCTFCGGNGICDCGETSVNCPQDCGSPPPIETCTHTISWSANTDCGSYVLMWCFVGSTFNCMNPGPYCAPCVYPTSKSYDATVAKDYAYNWKVYTKLKQCDSDWHQQDSGQFTPSGSTKSVSFDTESNACGSQMYMEYCVGDRANLPCATFTDAYGGCICMSISGHSSSSVSLSGLEPGVQYYWKLWAHEENCGSTNVEIESGSFTDDCCTEQCTNWPSTCAETMNDGCGGTCSRDTEDDPCGTRTKTWNDYCSSSTQWCDRNSDSNWNSRQTSCTKRCDDGSCASCSPNDPGCGTSRICPSSSQIYNDYCLYNSTVFCDINGDDAYNNYISTCTNACSDITGCALGSCTPTNPGCGHQKMCVSTPVSDTDGGDNPNTAGTCTAGSSNSCAAGIGCNPVPGTGSGTDSCQGTCPGTCLAKEFYPADSKNCANKLYNPDVAQAACNLCSQQWLQGGETIPFGEYAAGNAVACCGDDAGEFTRPSEPKPGSSGLGLTGGNPACCNAITDCSYDGVCYPTGYCRTSPDYGYYCDNGQWRAQDLDGDGFDDSCETHPNDECAVNELWDWCGKPNCPSCLFGTTRQDSCIASVKPPLGLVEVFTAGYSDTSLANGSYTIAPLNPGTYTFTGRKIGYFNAVIPDYQINLGKNHLDINLTPGSGLIECLPDCTTSSTPGFCGPCDCLNGCHYYDARAEGLCSGIAKDNIVRYNLTHELRCCNGIPYPIERIPANVYVNSSTIITIQRVVWFEGRIIKMYITVFE